MSRAAARSSAAGRGRKRGHGAAEPGRAQPAAGRGSLLPRRHLYAGLRSGPAAIEQAENSPAGKIRQSAGQWRQPGPNAKQTARRAV